MAQAPEGGWTTHTDAPADDLVARLNSTFLRFNMGHREEPLRNPDGPEAAARIRSLEAQRDQAVEVIAAAQAYFDGWMQDEAADDGPDFTGCSLEQHEAAKRLKAALDSLTEKR